MQRDPRSGARLAGSALRERVRGGDERQDHSRRPSRISALGLVELEVAAAQGAMAHRAARSSPQRARLAAWDDKMSGLQACTVLRGR